MAATTIYASVISTLKSEYSGGIIWGDPTLLVLGQKELKNTGFIGATTAIFLTSPESASHEAPACIAAPSIALVAKKTMSFGVSGQGSHEVPVRLYAPLQLSITTRHLFIGELNIMIEPQHAFISCDKLTIITPGKQAPDYVETVKSWLINDKVEIEQMSVLQL